VIGGALAARETYTHLIRRVEWGGREGRSKCIVCISFLKMADYKSCEADVKALIQAENCGPVLIRFAWHDSGAYDAKLGKGGANGSIIHKAELAHGGNAGLSLALELLTPIKAKYDAISWADLIQMGSAVAVETMGGPHIDLKYGRKDVGPEDVPIEGRLPSAHGPFQKADGPAPAEVGDKKDDPAARNRRVFHRMGLEDRDIVALSGAHTVGRVHKSRSGAAPNESSKYTADGPGRTKGGMPWVPEWLVFDNSYFRYLKDTVAEGKAADPELVTLPTDAALMNDPGFKPIAMSYAEDQALFFKDYAASHKKLSELGCVWA